MVVQQRLSEEPLRTCPNCGESPCRRVITPEGMAQVNTHAPAIDCTYYSSLAKKPRDPEAYVSGPHSLQRLIDKRKREGWDVQKADQVDLIDPRAEKKKEQKARRKEILRNEFGI